MAALETDAISTVAIGTEQKVGSYTVAAGVTRVSVRVYLEDCIASAQTFTARLTNTPTGESEATEAFYSTPKHTAANTAFILSFSSIDVETGDVLNVYVTSSAADTVSGHCKFFDGTAGKLSEAGLADFFDTDSGKTFSDAVAGSVVKEIADHSMDDLDIQEDSYTME